MCTGKLSPEELYVRLGRLVETMPNLGEEDRPSTNTLQWLGRAAALVSEVVDLVDVTQFRTAASNLGGGAYVQRKGAARDIALIVYRALAAAELQAPATSQGAFIPAGNAFDALGAVAKALGGATQDVLVVDPYMDATFMTDFAALAKEGVSLRLLADAKTVKPSLRPAVERWQLQYGATRPVAAKLSAPGTLHDRLIVADSKTVWVLTQSFNAFAARAPASIVRTDDETARLKIDAYEALWSASSDL